MATETHVNLLLQSASLYEGLLRHVGSWSLQEHEFDPDADELRVSYDVTGAGRVALTIGFELTRDEMADLLASARPITPTPTDGPLAL